jgi:hypothetical protein
MIMLMSMLLKLFALILLLTIIAGISFAWYYFYTFQPKKMAFIAEQGDIQSACLAGADAKYQDFWDRECNGYGYQPKCRLPTDNVARLDQVLSDDKNACNVKYTEALKTVNYIFPWDKKDTMPEVPTATPTPSAQ